MAGSVWEEDHLVVTGLKSGFAECGTVMKSAVLSSFAANLGMCCGPPATCRGALHRLEALEHGDLLRAVRTFASGKAQSAGRPSSEAYWR